MIEIIRTIKENGRAVAAAGLFSAVALTGCSSHKTGEWRFAVSCDEGKDLNIEKIVDGDVTITCGEGSARKAPVSVELIEGVGTQVHDPTQEDDAHLNIGYEYNDGGFFDSPNPRIQSVKIDSEAQAGQIVTLFADLTQVSAEG